MERGNGCSGVTQLSLIHIFILQKMSYSQLDEHGYMVWNCLASGQEGYYITNGKAIPITWTKNSDLNRTIYRDLNGDETVSYTHLGTGRYSGRRYRPDVRTCIRILSLGNEQCVNESQLADVVLAHKADG